MMPGADERVVVDREALMAQCQRLLEALGIAPEDAAATASVFCQAESMGEESHGIRLFLHVLGRVKAGGDRTRTEITTVMDRGAVGLWDANRSLGQVVAVQAMRAAMKKAAAHGIGLVTVRNGNSLTSAKFYPLLAADAGMIGCTFTNTSRKLMPPPGGATPVIGNNPVAYAAPAGRYGSFVLDMACTAVAVERIVRARELGEKIPLGWALDADGTDTADPEKALQSLALLPFGGHKAFGLAMVHELMTSVLAGGALFAGDATGFMPYDAPMNTSFTMLAIDISAFQPIATFERRMETVIETIKSSRPRGLGFNVSYPGERSLAEAARRETEGIPLAGPTFASLNEWAAELKVVPLAGRVTGRT
jgi:LDH2 family malate/lactate/ureidoglycolate dehydrogenase